MRGCVKLEMKLRQITHSAKKMTGGDIFSVCDCLHRFKDGNFLSIYLSSIFFQCSSIQMKGCPIVIMSSSSASMATSAQTMPEPLRHEHSINKHMLAAYRIHSIKDGLKLWCFFCSLRVSASTSYHKAAGVESNRSPQQKTIFWYWHLGM